MCTFWICSTKKEKLKGLKMNGKRNRIESSQQISQATKGRIGYILKAQAQFKETAPSAARIQVKFSGNEQN